MKISVVVPAMNEEKLLPTLLHSLQAQKTSYSYEVVVADAKSTDSTRKIAGRLADRVVSAERGAASLARNAGARAAKGSVLVFVDADSVASPSLVQSYGDAFSSRRKLVAATGPILPLDDDRKRMRAAFKVFSDYWMRLLISVGSPMLTGINSAYRRGAFSDAGMFNPRMKTFEDCDLSLRMSRRGEIGFVDGAVVFSSTRRIREWGYPRFVWFHATNIVKYHKYGRPRSDYEDIR